MQILLKDAIGTRPASLTQIVLSQHDMALDIAGVCHSSKIIAADQSAPCFLIGEVVGITRQEDGMKYHELDQLQTLARIGQDYPQLMPRNKRLQRWVELLETDPDRVLSTLHETEYQPATVRAAIRCNNSAISVAFGDPLLRAAGLANDTYGEAKRFFELSDNQLHRIVCSCHFGATASSGKVARYIRAKHIDREHGIWGRLRAMFA